MRRTLALILAALALAPAVASAKVVLTVTADATQYASADEKATFRVNPRLQRVRLTYAATQVTTPFTRDADYARVYGTPVTTPVTKADGTLALECRKKGQAWWRSVDSRRTFRAGTTTVRLPLRSAYECRASVSVSATGSEDFMTERLDSVSANATLDTVR